MADTGKSISSVNIGPVNSNIFVSPFTSINALHVQYPNMRFTWATSVVAGIGMVPMLASALSLNVTAVAAKNGSSIFQCWSLDSPFKFSTQPGIVGSAYTFLGDIANMTYSVLPPGYVGGDHNAPSNQ